MKDAIQIAIDSAGRLVLPKAVREEAGILPGMSLQGVQCQTPRRELSSVLVDSNVILDVVTEGLSVGRVGLLHAEAVISLSRDPFSGCLKKAAPAISLPVDEPGPHKS